MFNPQTPNHIKKTLNKRNIDYKAIKISLILKFPLKETKEGQTWLGVDDKNLYCISIIFEKDKKKLNYFKAIPLSEIKKVFPDNQVNSGKLIVLLNNDKELSIARYPRGETKEVVRFAGLVIKLSNGQELTEQDLKDKMQLICPECGRYFIDPVRQICPKCLDKKSIFYRLLSYSIQYRKQQIIIL